MIIKKKVKCLHCASLVEGENSKCDCGKIMIVENVLIEKDLIVGKDFIDMSPKVLCE